MDLSLQQNVEAASSIFKPFYEDRDIMHDMVQTKKYYNELQRGERLKSCTDPEKCPGIAWQEGFSELHFKADEFKKMSDDEALNFSMPSFTPYYNWEKDAIKLAKDANLNVTQDHITGQWIVREKNGRLVQGGLLNLFTSTYGNDPRVINNYNTKSYVDRKNFVINNWQQYGSEEQAEIDYLTKQINDYNNIIHPVKKGVEQSSEEVKARKIQLERDANTPGVGVTSEEEDLINRIAGVDQTLDATKADLERSYATVNNSVEGVNIATLRKKGDAASAWMRMNSDLHRMAETMSYRDAELTYKENPYGVLATKHAYDKEMAGINYTYDLKKIAANLDADMTKERFKKSLEVGAIPMSVETILDRDPSGIVRGASERGITRNTEMVSGAQQDANMSSSEFLYNAMKNAQIAAKDNPGARNYLTNLYGKDYAKILTKEDMLKALKSTNHNIQSAFDYTKNNLSSDKNPMGDVNWAKQFMTTNARAMNNIQVKNDIATAMAKRNIEINKDIVNQMRMEAAQPGKVGYTDADLLLTPEGFAIVDEEMPTDFAANYKRKYPNDPDWFENAEDSYDALRGRFVELFQNKKGASLIGGAGLTGGNQLQANAVRVDNVSNLAKLDRNTSFLENTLGSIVGRPDAYNVIIGDPTAENMAEQKMNNPQAKSFMTQFFNDFMKKGKEDQMTVSYVKRKVAGGNENISAVTVYLDQDYVTKYIGSKEKPGALFGMTPALLSQGVTMYFNNKAVHTPLDQEGTESEKELVARFSGIKYDSYPNVTKDVRMDYDPSRGKFTVSGNIKKYVQQADGSLNQEIVQLFDEILPGTVDKVDAGLNLFFAELEKKNQQAQRINAQLRQKAKSQK